MRSARRRRGTRGGGRHALGAGLALLALGSLLSPALGGPGTLSSRVYRFEVEPSGPGGLLDARERVPLREGSEGWVRLLGRRADPARPELHRRRPAPVLRLIDRGRPGRALELASAAGSHVLVRGPIETAPPGAAALRVRLSGRGRPLDSGTGRLRLQIELPGDGEGPPRVLASPWIGGDRWTPAPPASGSGTAGLESPWRALPPWSVDLPSGTRRLAVRLEWKAAPREEGRTAVLVDELQLQWRARPRVDWGGRGEDRPLFLTGEPVRIASDLPALEGGRYRLRWAVRPRAGGPAVREGVDRRWVGSDCTARHELVIEKGLEAGSWRWELEWAPQPELERSEEPTPRTSVDGVGEGRLERDFVVLPLGIQASRDRWEELAPRLASRRLASVLDIDPRGLFLLFESRTSGDPAALLTVSLHTPFHTNLPGGLSSSFDREETGARISAARPSFRPGGELLVGSRPELLELARSPLEDSRRVLIISALHPVK